MILRIKINNGNGIKTYDKKITGDETEEELEQLASDIFFEHCYYEFEIIDD